jgi:hypothetical protein
MARCSSNTACTTATGASTTLKVYPGDGSDVALSVSHERTTGVTTLRWPARPQPPAMSGYDVFRGSQSDDGLSTTAGTPDTSLSSLGNISCGTGVGVPVGTDVVVTSSAAQPATNTVHYYLVGHSSTVAGARTALGRGLNNAVRLPPVAAACP